MRWMWLSWTAFLAALLVVVPGLVNQGYRWVEAPPASGDPVGALPVLLYHPDEQRLETVPLHEYLVGVVAAEMPPEFADEALKAQMVVARTYTVKHMRRFGGRGCPLHPRADACTGPEFGQAYTTLAELRAREGVMAARRYWQRLQQLETATAGLVVTYRGAPIDALYHAASAERTESGEAYFGNPVPYLQPVADPWGREAPRYRETIRLSVAELEQALGVTRIDPGAPIRVLAHTASGRVATAQVGNRIFTGRELRQRLGLRSTRFDTEVRNGGIYITTLGYGHGVGMSQYGANGMARRGADFLQIIAHYYPGVRVEPLTLD